MTHAILYARFSPRRDADKCASIESQLEDMLRHCAAVGWDVRSTFEDRALSGKDMGRPGLWAALGALQPGDVLLVRNLDRLARGVMLSEILQREVAKRHARVVSVSGEGTQDDSPEAVMIRQIFQVMAEFNRAQIAARTSAKMLLHQAQGRRMGSVSHRPYGWAPDPEDPARMVPDRRERALKTAIFCLWRRNWTGEQIARSLNGMGLLGRGDTPWTGSRIRGLRRRAGWPSHTK